MIYWLIRTLPDDSIGKWFGNNGDRYEGEWKDGNMHGQGKKEMINLMIDLRLFDDSIGKWFWNSGDRYEGEFQDNEMKGHGR